MGGRGAGYALLALAGVLFIAAVVSGWSAATGFQGRGAAAHAVERAAVDFVVAYGTFDYRDTRGYTEQLVSLTTGPLRAAIAAAAVDPAAARAERAVTTRIEAVSVSAIAEDEASVFVTAVQERRWVDADVVSPARRHLQETVRQRMTCRLVREDGRWLVAEVRLESMERVSATRR